MTQSAPHATRVQSGSKDVIWNFLHIRKMEPEIEDRPELEHLDYYRLSYEELERIGDAESMLERGFRLINAIGVKYDVGEGVCLIKAANRLGHPVARAFPVSPGAFEARSSDVVLHCSESVRRGHPIGILASTL